MKELIAVTLIIFKGQFGLTPKEAETLLSDVAARYEQELGKGIRVMRVDWYKRDPTTKWAKGVGITDLNGRYFKLHQWLTLKGYGSSKRVKLVVLPPAQADGKLWVYGAASLCSYRKGKMPLAMVVATPKNASGESRIEHARSTMAHEIGHTVCMGHDDSISPPTTMHSAALQFVTGLLPDYLRFSPKSIGEALAKWGK